MTFDMKLPKMNLSLLRMFEEAKTILSLKKIDISIFTNFPEIAVKVSVTILLTF